MQTRAKNIGARMSATEERDLISRAQAGGAEAMATILAQFEFLFWKLARKYSGRNPRYDLEDAYQDARFAAVRCLRRFDLSYQVRFITYLHTAVDRELGRIAWSDGLIYVPVKPIDVGAMGRARAVCS